MSSVVYYWLVPSDLITHNPVHIRQVFALDSRLFLHSDSVAIQSAYAQTDFETAQNPTDAQDQSAQSRGVNERRRRALTRQYRAEAGIERQQTAPATQRPNLRAPSHRNADVRNEPQTYASRHASSHHYQSRPHDRVSTSTITIPLDHNLPPGPDDLASDFGPLDFHFSRAGIGHGERVLYVSANYPTSPLSDPTSLPSDPTSAPSDPTSHTRVYQRHLTSRKREPRPSERSDVMITELGDELDGGIEGPRPAYGQPPAYGSWEVGEWWR